ncbi:hypothetical protein BC835DRAFT_1486777 [Cytidiella melzeri]|nr:hypothetical protein BC835DRAFT_1486777 [Cytidiella melzeri]
MHFSTSLILLVAMITYIHHTVTVSAVPVYDKSALHKSNPSIYPFSSVSPSNTLVDDHWKKRNFPGRNPTKIELEGTIPKALLKQLPQDSRPTVNRLMNPKPFTSEIPAWKIWSNMQGLFEKYPADQKLGSGLRELYTLRREDLMHSRKGIWVHFGAGHETNPGGGGILPSDGKGDAIFWKNKNKPSAYKKLLNKLWHGSA